MQADKGSKLNIGFKKDLDKRNIWNIWKIKDH